MGLIVFDMGRRIETPTTSPRRRVSALSATDAAAPIHRHEASTNSSLSDGLTYSPDGNQEQRSHSPQAVAFARDIMAPSVITVTPETSLEDAFNRMQEYGIHHLPVADGAGIPQAMISDRSLLRAMLESGKHQQQVIEIASRPVYCVLDSTDIRQAARLLCDYHIGALPVINEEQRLTGIITRTDLLRLISDYGPLELWA